MFLAAIMVLSVVAMSAAFAGSAAAANHADLDAQEDDLGNINVWQGEHLVIENVSTSVIIDGYTFSAEDGDDAEVNTAQLDTGTHTLYVDRGTESEVVGSITVNEPDLNASFSPSSAEDTTNLVIESSLGNAFADEFSVSIEGTNLNTNEELDNEDVEDFLGVSDAEDVTVDSSMETIEGDVSALAATSDHQFTVTVNLDDVDASDTANFYSGDADQRNLGFAADQFETTEGDILEFEVDVDNHTEAYLIIENIYGDDQHIAITDASDEDSVTVKLHTYYYGHDEEKALWTEDQATVEFDGGMLDLAEDDRHLQTQSHRALAYSDDRYLTRFLEDRTQLAVNDRDDGSSDSWIAPEAVAGDGPQTLVEDGEYLTDYDVVAEGDLIVAEFEAYGVFDFAFLNEDGNVAMGDDERVAFNDEEITFSLDEMGVDYELEVDAENNTFYVLVDSSDVGADEVDLDWSADSLDLNSDTESFDIVDPEIGIDILVGDVYQVNPDDAYVTGTTTLAPHTVIDLEAEYEREFFETDEIVVDSEMTDTGYFTFEHVWEDGFDASLLEDDVPVEDRQTWTIALESNLHDRVVFDAVFAEDPESDAPDRTQNFIDAVADILGVDIDDPHALSTDELEQLTNAIQSQETTISDLNDEIAQLESDLDDANDEIADLNEEIEGLESDISDLESQIDELEADASENEQEIADLNTEIDDLNAQISDLEGDLEDAQDERDSLQSDLNDAQDERDSLQSDLDEINSAIEDAGYDDIDELISAYEDLMQENEDLKQENEDLKQENADLRSDDNGDDDADDSDDGTPGFGIAVAITALIGAALLAVRRQN